MSNLALVESVPREPLHFVLSPFDNHKEQYTLQVTNDIVYFTHKVKSLHKPNSSLRSTTIDTQTMFFSVLLPLIRTICVEPPSVSTEEQRH